MKHITLLGHVGAVTSLLAAISTPTLARPLVLQPTQVLTSPTPRIAILACSRWPWTATGRW